MDGMPQAREWSEVQDTVILTMRAAGSTWAAIGQRLGMSRNTVIERGRRIHAAAGVVKRGPATCPAQAVAKKVSEDENRGALPAGHPLTWGLIAPGIAWPGIKMGDR